MDYRSELLNVVKENNGLVLTKDVEGSGIPRHYLTTLVRENVLDRVGHGVYISREAFEDEMYILQARNKSVIFSHETALYLHDLTDRDPLQLVVTIPTSNNGTKLKEDGGKVYKIKRELQTLGMMEAETVYGRPVTIYNKERTICDLVRSRSSIDIAVLNEGIKRYLESNDRNIPLLLRYADKFNVQRILRNYLEILL
ncbi:type IV toxin-antitoxin system AbiEi family antitoxin domain-containing protein [Virgibacillus sp. NKC19-16]|uniref:type IV toxin-antitoxin system AbiEi family antitoxin domain-containing protein n=1 Tax=Virgibacillus salidurans TaxID=2831673 RepID=UPI001F29EED8|nr:type IV toxin-antitoxin system AbiEi family antitoxin domain-containing protein [Virgibacillus sp. NKC19-16]UJL45833.1 type IV toxin-antitoxin system AbiEi family antitoxin domain-containing protein [Virgibacillus sp. NKC19-16]